ncbi:TonB-dependent receptor [Bacteroidota bacterium]
MKALIQIVFLLFITFPGFTQVVTVSSKTDQQAIFNVFVFNSNKSTITDEFGKADLSEFKQSDHIVFQHPTYKNLHTTYEYIKKHNFIVKLEESVLNIDEIVISANQWEQKKSEVPSTIHTISVREIQFSNPQTTADLLEATDKVFIQKSQMGGGSPIIRGFSANRILLVVDGVRMNNAIYRSGNLQNVISLDANAVESSEVILGPGSVVYGSDAIGGVIDFHTKNPKLSTTENPYITSNALIRYASANFEKTGHLDFNLGFQKVAFFTSFTFTDYDDLKMGSHKNDEYIRSEYVDQINSVDTILQNDDIIVQRYTAYNQLNILQKIRYRPSKNIDVVYAFHYSKLSDVPRYDRLIEYSNNQLKYAEWYYGPQKWMMNSLMVTQKSELTLYDNSKLIVAIQNYEESRNDRKFKNPSLRHRQENVRLVTVNLDFDKKIKENTELFYGFEIADNLVNSMGKTKNVNTGTEIESASRYPDNSKFSTIALYINQKQKLKENISLIAGIRYNNINANARFDTTFYQFPYDEINLKHNAFNGSLGIVYKPIVSTQFQTNISTGFRAPNIDDVGKVFDSEPGNVIVPNEKLAPEYVYNLDLGFISSFYGRLQLEGTFFGSYINNVMVRSDAFTFNGMDSIIYDGTLSKVESYINADYGFLYGASFSLYADILDHLSLKSHLNFIKGTDQDDNPLRHVTPSYGATHFIYTRENFKADLYLLYNGVLEYDDLSLSEKAKPHIYARDENGNSYSPRWFTINCKTSFQITKVFQINAGIENILNVRYRPYSSGIVAPGRNFIIALRGRF